MPRGKRAHSQLNRQTCVHILWRSESPSPAQLAAWDRLWQRLLGPVDIRNDNAPAAGPPGCQLDASTVTSSAVQLEGVTNDNTVP